ncbi:MAG: prepilin-type N-terminal cleavage/methylation domain-containing protein [Sphingopyxis sp.]|nr:prepilin-type N-terminal cleavage/methylation domain-containing protein [Sphingopyxis sp.]
MSKSPVEQGFTLIELLVVLAVMGLLTVLLVPQLQSVRDTRDAGALEDALTDLREARFKALDEGRSVAVEVAALPGTPQWQPAFPASAPQPVFAGEGSATGGTLLFADGQAIRISWIDGHAARAR